MKLKYFPPQYLEALADSFVASIMCNFKAGQTKCTIRMVYERKRFRDKENMRVDVFPMVVKALKDKATVEWSQSFRHEFIIVKIIAVQSCSQSES